MKQSLGRMNVGVLALVAVVILFAIGGLLYMTQSQRNTDDGSTVEQRDMTEDTNTNQSDETSMMEEEGIKDFAITASNFQFSQKEIRVKVGDTVRVTLSSESDMHDWVIDEFDARTQMLSAGEAESVVFVADKAGEFEYYCSVGDHRQMGMVGTLIVEE